MGEWDNRELCPDDACVGVIGKDGTCGVCGRVSPTGVKPVAALADADADDAEPAELPATAAAASPDVVVDGEVIDAETGDDWDQRALCPDGACTGVIGSSGKCSVCARTATEITADSSP